MYRKGEKYLELLSHVVFSKYCAIFYLCSSSQLGYLSNDQFHVFLSMLLAGRWKWQKIQWPKALTSSWGSLKKPLAPCFGTEWLLKALSCKWRLDNKLVEALNVRNLYPLWLSVVLCFLFVFYFFYYLKQHELGWELHTLSSGVVSTGRSW